MSGIDRRRRVGHAIQRELPELLRGLKDPRLDTLISFSSVEVSADLSVAKIYFTRIGSEDADQTLAGLQHAAGFLRRGIAQRLSSRRVPRLEFLVDHLPQQSGRIDALLRAAAEKNGNH
ncbi:MAG: 30S ribosome-binding factor RbfA [Gammaproteobacteria bacterium]